MALLTSGPDDCWCHTCQRLKAFTGSNSELFADGTWVCIQCVLQEERDDRTKEHSDLCEARMGERRLRCAAEDHAARLVENFEHMRNTMNTDRRNFDESYNQLVLVNERLTRENNLLRGDGAPGRNADDAQINHVGVQSQCTYRRAQPYGRFVADVQGFHRGGEVERVVQQRQ